MNLCFRKQPCEKYFVWLLFVLLTNYLRGGKANKWVEITFFWINFATAKLCLIDCNSLGVGTKSCQKVK